MSLPSEEPDSDSQSLISITLAETHLTSPYPIYQWKPLSDPSKQIRVLNIIRTFDSQEIRCSLATVSHVIRPPPRPYQALSYVWGDATNKVPITLFEDGKPFTVYITRNLRAAIRDITSLSTNNKSKGGGHSADNIHGLPNLSPAPLCLWIDALCIDQSNDHERSMQVQIMSEVYARSIRVLVWLGPIPGAEAKISTQEMKNFVHYESTRDQHQNNRHIPNQFSSVNEPAIYLALKTLFLLPWWSRVWVVQEVVFGSDIVFVYGSCKIPWNMIGQALQDAGLIEKYNPAHHTAIEIEIHGLAAGFIQLDEQKKQHESFGEFNTGFAEESMLHPPIDVVLWAHRTRKASIQHDKLYALLSLTDKSIHILPDYTRPIESVFCQLANALITRHPSPTFPLDHIGFTHCTEHTRPAKLPSWVPDWTTCPYDVQLLGNYDPWISSFGADDHILDSLPTLLQALLAQRSWHPHQLPILGAELGQLTQIGQSSSVDLDIREWPALIRSWASQSHLLPNIPTHVFIQTLLGGRYEDRRTRLPDLVTACSEDFKIPHISPQFYEWYKTVLNYNLQKDLLPLHQVKRIAEAAKGWTIGCLTGNHLALVPSNAMEKDLICIPVGSSTPFLIRSTGKRCASGNIQHRLVGRCYVHGLMDGEAMADIRSSLKIAESKEVSDAEKQKLVLAQLKCFVLV